MDEKSYLTNTSNEEINDMLDIALSPNFEEVSGALYEGEEE